MQNIKAGRAAAQPVSFRLLLLAILLIALLGIGLYATNIFKVFQSASPFENAMRISPGALETTYGLRVNLIAVTAAGGMVDVRLQIVDAEKAKSFLQDKKNFPALWVHGSNMILNVAEETKSQEIKFEADGNVFLLFPNSGGAVRPGTSVSLVFGDIALEQLEVK